VVEQPAVNRLVAGSNPARGATTIFARIFIPLIFIGDDRRFSRHHDHLALAGRILSSFLSGKVSYAVSKFPYEKFIEGGVEPDRTSNRCEAIVLRVGSRHTTPTGTVKGRTLVATGAATFLLLTSVQIALTENPCSQKDRTHGDHGHDPNRDHRANV
jgi:hypothetical protein